MPRKSTTPKPLAIPSFVTDGFIAIIALYIVAQIATTIFVALTYSPALNQGLWAYIEPYIINSLPMAAVFASSWIMLSHPLRQRLFLALLITTMTALLASALWRISAIIVQYPEQWLYIGSWYLAFACTAFILINLQKKPKK